MAPPDPLPPASPMRSQASSPCASSSPSLTPHLAIMRGHAPTPGNMLSTPLCFHSPALRPLRPLYPFPSLSVSCLMYHHVLLCFLLDFPNGSLELNPDVCSQFVLCMLSIKFFDLFLLLAICQILNEIPNEHWLAILLNIGCAFIGIVWTQNNSIDFHPFVWSTSHCNA